MNTREQIHQLFAKWLAGNCSRAEWEVLLVLVSGIDESDTETLTAPLLQLWENARNKALPSVVHLIDKEQIFARVTAEEAVTSTTEVIGKTGNVSRFSKAGWWRMVAAIFICVLAGVSGYYYFNHSTDIIHADINRVAALPAPGQPGINAVVLTLEDGKQLLLDSSVHGLITTQGATDLENDKGRLSYQPIQHKQGSEQAMDNPVYNTVHTANAMQYQLQLPDGTMVWLNAATTLTFPVAFNGSERNIELDGEAYFEVAKDSSHPFHIKTKRAIITVLGTHFNVNAYANENETNTTLLEGAVQVDAKQMQVRLKPGQAVHVNKAQMVVTPADTVQAIAWKNGFFYFNNISLPVLLREIGRWYNLEIVYKGAIPDSHFSGEMERRMPLGNLLSILETGDVHCEQQGNSLIVLASK